MNRTERCHHLLASLSEYVDGELSDELCIEINRHLADCKDCQVVVDTLRKTVYLYHAASAVPEVPAEVRERLYRCLNLDDFLHR
jgi:anti-sigma factor RsiW